MGRASYFYSSSSPRYSDIAFGPSGGRRAPYRRSALSTFPDPIATAAAPRALRLRLGAAAPLRMSSSPSDDDDDDGGGRDDDPPPRSDLDAFRALLEESWDSATMGSVPTSPEGAASAASESVRAAASDGNGVVLIDVRLPAFDVTSGPNVYDDVAAVEFCAALAGGLRGGGSACRCLILVRDGNIVRDVGRVLDAKERRRIEEAREAVEAAALDEEEEDDDDEEEDDDDVVDYYDDFADYGGVGGDGDGDDAAPSVGGVGGATSGSVADSAGGGGGGGTADGDGVDSFRRRLMESWDRPPAAEGGDEPGDDPAPPRAPREEKVSPPEEAEAAAASAAGPSSSSSSSPPGGAADRPYRLSSLFGDAVISSGPDMYSDVASAVSANGKLDESAGEDCLIILCPASPPETAAVRGLVDKYGGGGDRTVIIVNGRFDPLPRELIGAVAAYSISPLIARSARDPNDPLREDQRRRREEGGGEEEEEDVTKVVVLRRYPHDWEVFIDADGGGFELADTVSSGSVGRDGPSMEYVAGCVKRHMQAKFGRF